MLEWLNDNANVVIAVASVASAGVTVVLAWLTSKYVRLTDRIATAASAQLAYVQAVSDRERAMAHESLRMLAIRLRATLESLGENGPHDRLIREHALLAARDVDLLEALARPTDNNLREHAMLAVMGLRSILGLIGRVKATSASQGYRYNETENAEYRDALQEAKLALDALAAAQQPRGVQ